MFEFFEPVLNSLCTEGWPWSSDPSASLKMLELQEHTTTSILCPAGTQDFVVPAIPTEWFALNCFNFPLETILF